MANKAAQKAQKAKPQPPIPGLGTAAGDKLRSALHAFDAGDYVQVRALTNELAEGDDAEVRDAAIELRERISIDPVQIVVLSACAAVLATILYVWVL